jgi:hypothetical protein
MNVTRPGSTAIMRWRTISRGRNNEAKHGDRSNSPPGPPQAEPRGDPLHRNLTRSPSGAVWTMGAITSGKSAGRRGILPFRSRLARKRRRIASWLRVTLYRLHILSPNVRGAPTHALRSAPLWPISIPWRFAISSLTRVQCRRGLFRRIYLTAGDRHGFPLRFARALDRCARCMANCVGLISTFCASPPLDVADKGSSPLRACLRRPGHRRLGNKALIVLDPTTEATMVLPSFRVLALVLMAAAWPGTAGAAAFDWRRELLAIERGLAAPGILTPANCSQTLGAWTGRLAALPSADFAPRSEREAAKVLAQGDRWLERFFHVRLLLKRRWNSFASPSHACLDAMRRAFRYARFGEDYLAEWLMARGGLANAPKALLDGGPPHVLTNPAAGGVDLRPGDVLLMRGPDPVAGLIARSGDEQDDFSHLAIVGRDDAGRKYIVEALIQTGTIVTPLDDYLTNTNVWRVVVLRYHDGAVADSAALEIYRRARAALDAGRPIPYNFALDMSDDTRFLCTQVADYAYRIATNGHVRLPEFPTRLTHFLGTPIARAIKVSVAETFAPSDLQFDRRFEIVAEFRNPALITTMRHANVAISRLLAWLQSGYDFGSDLRAEIVGRVMLALMVVRSGPVELDVAGAVVLTKAREASTILSTRAAAIDAQAVHETGHALTFRELEARLEEFRRADCEASRANPSVSSELHKLLIPPRSGCTLTVVPSDRLSRLAQHRE